MLNKKPEKKTSKIEKLKKSLYSNKERKSNKFFGLRSKKYDVDSDWQDDTLSPASDMTKKTKKEKNWIEKFLIVSIILFVLASVAFALTMLGGTNRVSNSNVDISVIGPSSVESGGELSLQISVENNNPTDLELADLIIKYPKGTRSINGAELEKFRESLGTVPAGDEIRKEIKAVLYGEENSDKEIIISLEYRIADSNAIFFKDRSYDIKISSSPVNLIISPIEESISGQEVNFSVSVVSNTNSSLDDLILVADYPFGFEFKESSPMPDFDNNGWRISGEEQSIKIKGVISGQEGDERVFRFTAGTPTENDDEKINAVFAFVEKSLNIKRPFLGINIAINGESFPEYTLNPQKPVRVDVVWQNNSPAKILDGEISIKLRGDIIDKSSVSVDKGHYISSNNTILWDKRTNGELSEIGLGEGGRFSFYFETLDVGVRGAFTNPEILIDVNAKGNRVFEGDIPEEITSTITRKIKVSSDLAITPRGTYYSGPFVNTGPLPPEVDQETTYTITWTITNTMNDVTGVRAISSLPPYVRWMGVVSPSNEQISYNPVGGEIVWNVGDIEAGTGIKTTPKEISFQVALLPSISQVNTVPDLTSDVKVIGTDRFTSESLTYTARSVNTRINTDPGFTSNKAVITQ